jgi:hypothetical protein
MRLLTGALVLAALLANASPAAAATRISVDPDRVGLHDTQTVRGRGWPVIEFCSRRVRISLRSDQNAVVLGHKRVRTSGRFRFDWIPADANVGPGPWRLIVRMRCESGDDGSPNFVRRGRDIRVVGH